MTEICERCYGPVDPVTERVYRLAHIDHADASGEVRWNHAVVHVDPCGSSMPTPAERQDRAA